MVHAEVRPGRALTEVGPHCELSAEARSMLAQHQTPDAYVRALRADHRSGEALHFLAHWLPKREAIWWGCLCTWHATRPITHEPHRAAIRAVVQWVQEPTEPRRRAAEKVMDPAGGTASVPGCLAFAAVLSGGSLNPEALPVVPPPAHLTAQTLVSLMLLAAAEKHPLRPEAFYDHFLDLGLEVLDGKNRWEKPVPGRS